MASAVRGLREPGRPRLTSGGETRAAGGSWRQALRQGAAAACRRHLRHGRRRLPARCPCREAWKRLPWRLRRRALGRCAARVPRACAPYPVRASPWPGHGRSGSAGCRCVPGAGRPPRHPAGGVAREHLLCQVQQLGVQRAVRMREELVHGARRIAAEAAGDRFFRCPVDPGEAGPQGFRVFRAEAAGPRQQLAQAARIGVAHAQRFDPSRSVRQVDGGARQHGQQSHQVACGLEVEIRGRGLRGHPAHSGHRLRELPLQDQLQGADHVLEAQQALAGRMALADAREIRHAALQPLRSVVSK